MGKYSENIIDLSILIVNYKTCELTCNAIRSVYQSETAYTYEIILVDNHSQDETLEQVAREFPHVQLIANQENVGFATANNQAIAASRGRYMLLLNSDTIVQPDTLETMVRFMDEHPKVGASGCKVILPNGDLDKACRRGFPTPSASFYYAFGLAKRFPDNPKYCQYQMTHLDPNQDYPVDCLVGAFMLVRREAINQVGGLDETFFMYGEDIDWCYRIKEAGWVIYYYPRTYIIHYKGASSRKKPFKIIYEFHRAMWLFHRKHYWRKYSKLTHSFVLCGILLKFGLSLAANTVRKARRS